MLKPMIVGTILVLLWPAHPGAAQQVARCQSTVQGRLDIIDFESKTFPGARKIRIWLPPGYDANNAKRYPVLYMLDGQNLFDRCTGYGGQEWTADEVATRLIAAGKIPPMIIVGIDNAGTRRAQEYLPYADPFNRSAPVEGEKLGDFLREVLGVIEGRYHAANERDQRGLGGSSYGGIATLHTVLTDPDLFGRALIESPSLQVGNGQLLRDTVSVIALPDRVALGMGAAESATPPGATPAQRAEIDRTNATVVDAAQRLGENLKSSVIPSRVRITIAPGAHHNEAAWAARLPDALTFLFGPEPQARR